MNQETLKLFHQHVFNYFSQEGTVEYEACNFPVPPPPPSSQSFWTSTLLRRWVYDFRSVVLTSQLMESYICYCHPPQQPTACPMCHHHHFCLSYRTCKVEVPSKLYLFYLGSHLSLWHIDSPCSLPDSDMEDYFSLDY